MSAPAWIWSGLTWRKVPHEVRAKREARAMRYFMGWDGLGLLGTGVFGRNVVIAGLGEEEAGGGEHDGAGDVEPWLGGVGEGGAKGEEKSAKGGFP